ncbi:unnamed protein product, partial [Meganyctiphanes norvegica]
MNTGEVVVSVGPGFGSGMMKSSAACKVSNSGGWAGHHDPWIQPATKEPPTNTSMDSGVAGLRDTPVHTPAPIHNNNNMVGNKGSNNNDDYDVPKFIVDHTTRTTYMKGRFLGKGGFARVHELTDLTTNKTYAGKIIPKSRITKPHHKEKLISSCVLKTNIYPKSTINFDFRLKNYDRIFEFLEDKDGESLLIVPKKKKSLPPP